MPASTMPSISSDFEYLSSATVDQPAPTLSSTPPSLSSISPTFLPLATEEQPEPETESIPSITSAFTFAPTPPSSSTFLPSPVRSAMNNQPESEHEAASTSMSVPLSLPLSTLHPLSPLSSTFLPSPVTSATDDQPEHASMSFHSASSLPSTSLLGSPITDNVPEIKPAPPSLSLCPSDLPVPTNLAPSPSTSNSQLCFPASSESTPASLSKPLELDDVKLESSPALAPSDVVTLSHPESSLLSLGETIPLLLAQHEASVTVPTPRHSTPPQRPPGLKTVDSDSSPLEIAPVPANLAPPPSTFVLPPIFSASSDLSSASPSPSLVLGNLELEFFPYPSSAVDFAPPEPPEFSQSLSSLGEAFPFLPASPEAPPIAHISPRSTPPQRLPELKTISSVSTRLEVTPAPASPAIPFAPQSQELPTVNEVWSTLAPRFPLTSPPLTLSRSGLARFNFSLVLITTTVLVSTLFNALTTLSILARKYWNKNEDFGNIQIGTLNTSSRDVFAQRLRLGQLTPRASRFVFDPGGPASSSRLFGTRRRSQAQVEDTRRHHLTLDTGIPIPVPTDHLIVFDLGGGAFVLEPAHEDSATFDEDARWRCLRLLARCHLSYY
ncbi:hypothetical protein EDB85DRAFT_2212664 [Lactarius pseudohatsudake]|nr:hypothetical protein EDB85DRAFT_2212664 [Lactarius pseudohatsudake]